MEWTQQQLDELNQASKSAVPCYLRFRSLAVWHCARGQSRSATARYLRTTRQSVGKWVRDFRHQGLDGLRIRAGRGRKPRISHDDVMDYFVQSPRNFGIKRTRWTLELLAEHVPSLKGFTRGGVRYMLNKLKVSYKRGQPHSHSPDPDYDEKKRGLKR